MLDLDEIARAGAKKMLAEALEAEVQAYLQAARGQRDENGHALLVRNGHARKRKVVLGHGAVEVRAPGVEDRRVDADGNKHRFKSVTSSRPTCESPQRSRRCCRSCICMASPAGISCPLSRSSEEFFGQKAGLSASTISRLTEQWQTERKIFMKRDLSSTDYVYVWVDGIHTGVRLGGDGRLCSLVVLGARLDGTKELVAIHDGYRESIESWAELLRDLKKRGMRTPVLAVGDGALGFWGALRDVFPETRCQRDWVHKTMNVLDALPKSRHSQAKAAIREITLAENKKEAHEAIEEFAEEFGPKWPKAVAKIENEKESLCSPTTTTRPSTGSIYARPTR